MTKSYPNIVKTDQNNLVKGFETKLGIKHTVTCEVASLPVPIKYPWMCSV
jgi:hypothetical protein